MEALRSTLERLNEASQNIGDIGEYEGELIVPESDPWQPELSGGPVEPSEIGDPRTLWSALVRAELDDDAPEALERALEAIAGYPLPPKPDPKSLSLALESSPELGRYRKRKLEERTEALFQERLLRELASQAGTSEGSSEPN